VLWECSGTLAVTFETHMLWEEQAVPVMTMFLLKQKVLWECGGTLAAPAITGGAIHKAMAFIAPKLVGGVKAPTPVGELGNVEMTQVRLHVEHL